MPGSPSSTWKLYRARVARILASADTSVLVAFWLFGRPAKPRREDTDDKR